MLVDELLRPIFVKHHPECMDDLQEALDVIAAQIRTSKLWVDFLIKPVFTIIEYTQAERESDWPLHVVVPLLANTKKVSLQAVHTSFVNTAKDNMTDNRLLNYRPLPINDEETYLTRRQRTTLSQLRSGHCKLLNSYKKSPDCGMDQQDVTHLFNCTAHPTALTHENVWDRPVKTIQELSFPDPENLD